MHTIKITPNLLFVYKQQIYQIAESNQKNRFGSLNRIESNRNFFARIGMLYCEVRQPDNVCLVNPTGCRAAIDQFRNKSELQQAIRAQLMSGVCLSLWRRPGPTFRLLAISVPSFVRSCFNQLFTVCDGRSAAAATTVGLS